MQNKSLILLFICFMILLSAAKAAESNQRPLYVSFINLIATPEKYIGKKIHVTGFAHIKFEWQYLHLSENDAKYKVMQNSMALKIKPDNRDQYKDITRKYVEVIGVFGVNPNSGMKYMKDIEKIEELGNWFKEETTESDKAADKLPKVSD